MIRKKTKLAPLDIQIGGNHYKKMAIQPAVFCEVNGLSGGESAIVGYICRWRDKNGKEDLEKIKHWCDLMIEIHFDEKGNRKTDDFARVPKEELDDE